MFRWLGTNCICLTPWNQDKTFQSEGFWDVLFRMKRLKTKGFNILPLKYSFEICVQIASSELISPNRESQDALEKGNPFCLPRSLTWAGALLGATMRTNLRGVGSLKAIRITLHPPLVCKSQMCQTERDQKPLEKWFVPQQKKVCSVFLK